MILLLIVLSCSIGPEKCPAKAGVIGSENPEAKVQKRGEYLKETRPTAFAHLVTPFRTCPPSPSPSNRIVFRFRSPFPSPETGPFTPIGASPSPIKAPFDGAENFPVSAPAFPAGLQGIKFPHIRKIISAYKKIYFRI